MWTKGFWKATAERMVRGAAIVVSGTYFAAGQDQVDSWTDVGQCALSGAVGALLLALAGGAFGKGDGPSFIGAEEVVPEN